MNNKINRLELINNNESDIEHSEQEESVYNNEELNEQKESDYNNEEENEQEESDYNNEEENEQEELDYNNEEVNELDYNNEEKNITDYNNKENLYSNEEKQSDDYEGNYDDIQVNNDEPIYVMTLELEKGRAEQIKIFAYSDPYQLAFDFCKNNDLDFNSLSFLTGEIECLMENYKGLKNNNSEEGNGSKCNEISKENKNLDDEYQSILELDEEHNLTERNKKEISENKINLNKNSEILKENKSIQSKENSKIENIVITNDNNFENEENINNEITVIESETNLKNSFNRKEISYPDSSRIDDEKIEKCELEIDSFQSHENNDKKEKDSNKISPPQFEESNIQITQNYADVEATINNYKEISDDTNERENNEQYIQYNNKEQMINEYSHAHEDEINEEHIKNEYSHTHQGEINEQSIQYISKDLHDNQEQIINEKSESNLDLNVTNVIKSKNKIIQKDKKIKIFNNLSRDRNVNKYFYKNNKGKNIFDRLYQDAEIKRRLPKSKLIKNYKSNIQCVHNKDVIHSKYNYGDFLHNRGKFLKEEKLKNIELIKSEIENKNLEEYTFKPHILNVFPYSKKKEKNTSKEFDLGKSNKGEEYNIITKDVLNRNSRVFDINNIAEKKLFKMEKLREKYNSECSFKPEINKNYEINLNFYERQEIYTNIINENKKKFEEQRNVFYDEKGNNYFKPKLISKSKNYNRNYLNRSNPSDVFLHNYTYANYYRNNKENLANKYSHVPKENIKNNSDSIFNKIKEEAFKKIFKELDIDQDDLITVHNIGLKNISKDILRIINPIITELRDDEETLNENEFVRAMEHLYESLSYDDRKIMIFYYKTKKSPGKTQYAFKPKTNINSKLLSKKFDKKIAKSLSSNNLISMNNKINSNEFFKMYPMDNLYSSNALDGIQNVTFSNYKRMLI